MTTLEGAIENIAERLAQIEKGPPMTESIASGSSSSGDNVSATVADFETVTAQTVEPVSEDISDPSQPDHP